MSHLSYLLLEDREAEALSTSTAGSAGPGNRMGQVTEKLRVWDQESTLHVLQGAIPACWKCPINLNTSEYSGDYLHFLV